MLKGDISCSNFHRCGACATLSTPKKNLCLISSSRETKYTKKSVMCEIIYEKKARKTLRSYAHGWRKDMNIFATFAPSPPPSIHSLLEKNVNLFSWWYKSRIKYDFSSCVSYEKKNEKNVLMEYRKPFLFVLSVLQERKFLVFGISILLLIVTEWFPRRKWSEKLYFCTFYDVYYEDISFVMNAGKAVPLKIII